jgi:3',5'-cyclic AMP phosphodiesterase CpdA
VLRVAHISDLHQLSLEGVGPLDFVGKRLTGGLNLLFNRGGEFPADVARALMRDLQEQRPDHLVVSGDVTNLAFPGELELVRGLLADSGLPPASVTVVPGNHDYYTRGSARRDDFCRILAEHLRGDLQPGPGRFPFVQLVGERVAVLALSSSRPSAPLMAVGTLGGRQLRLAEQLLLDPACRERFRLVVLHHPPWRDEHVDWHNRLTDHAALAAMLGRAGAELVVHGHLHRFIERRLAGPAGAEIPVIGVCSSTWLSPKDPARRAQYHIYRIGKGEGQDHRGAFELERRRFDPASGAFSAL